MTNESYFSNNGHYEFYSGILLAAPMKREWEVDLIKVTIRKLHAATNDFWAEIVHQDDEAKRIETARKVDTYLRSAIQDLYVLGNLNEDVDENLRRF